MISSFTENKLLHQFKFSPTFTSLPPEVCNSTPLAEFFLERCILFIHTDFDTELIPEKYILSLKNYSIPFSRLGNKRHLLQQTRDYHSQSSNPKQRATFVSRILLSAISIKPFDKQD